MSVSMRSRALIVSSSSMYSSHLVSTNASIACRVQLRQRSQRGLREESPSASAALGCFLCTSRGSNGAAAVAGEGTAIDGNRSSSGGTAGCVVGWAPYGGNVGICAAGGRGTACSNLRHPMYRYDDNHTL
jgi:hypothetical protein